MTSDREEIEDCLSVLDRHFGSWAPVHSRHMAAQAAALIRRLEKERDEARNKALDEAADIAHGLQDDGAGNISDAILALKSKEPT